MIARTLLAIGLLLVPAAGALAQDQSRPKERDGQPAPAPAPAPRPAGPSAEKLRAVEQRIVAEIHRLAMQRATAVQLERGGTGNYATAANPRALAICVFWDDITPSAVPTGTFGAAWAHPQAVARALGFCNRFKAQRGATRCECVIADRDGANSVAVPPAVTARVAAATP